MNLPSPRKSRAQRAYENLRLAAGRIPVLYSYELERIARALNPESGIGRMLIFSHHRWLDDSTTCFMDCLSSGYSSEFYKLVPRLAFFRAEKASSASEKILDDTRLVLEVKYQNTTVWLDAESGLPWMPHARCRDHRKHCNPERRAELERIEGEALGLVKKVLAEIEREKCSVLMWQEDWQQTTDQRRVQRLEFSTRPNSRAEFADPRWLASKYFPATVTYPEPQPNASLMHEVAA